VPTQILTEDEIDFDKYLQETDDAARVRPAPEYLDQVMHALAPAHESPNHPKLPFANAWMYFAPGEVTAWAGFNGSGKSMVQGQVMTRFAEQGQRICIASFEMKPARTLARIARQVSGQTCPTREKVAGFMNSAGQRIWLYDQQGTVKWERLIAVVKHSVDKLKANHFVIDSLMKCVRGEDDYNGQKDFVDALTTVARDYGIHIHFVHHLRKGETDERMPNRMDMKGTGAISDLVDNAILIWRNKKKERDRDAGKPVSDADPDAVLIVDKQRNGDWEGRVKLWYDRESLRFMDAPRRRGIAQTLGANKKEESHEW
jgi:twinkle protein